MKIRTSLTTPTLVVAFAFAALLGIMLPSPGAVYAAPPTFDDTDGRSVPENTPPGVNIGAPITATDPDETGDAAIEFGNNLTYSLQPSADSDVARADAASFDIDPATGQLITKAPLDADGDKTSYTVTVKVDDGVTPAATCATCTRDVTITVTGVTTETPLAPHPPTVVSRDDPTTDANESTTSLKVVWHPPDNTGRPEILTYEVVYKKSTETNFNVGDNPNTDATEVVTLGAADGTARTATITELEADTSYDVRVRATNADGTGLWSLAGTGSTNKEGNNAPSFNEDDSLVERDVDENTPSGENIDSPVTATDGDTTTLTYGLEGPHADLFSFDTRSGQIRTKAPLNHEDALCGYVDTATDTSCIYRVTVTVVDRAGGSDATRVNIEVDDRSEPPSAPARPTVRATEKSSTSLNVSWNAPENMGSPITGYEVRYRKGAESFTASGVTFTGTTTATISGDNGATPAVPWLSPNTSYEVRVRAINAERTSEWSASGTGRTNRANHQPIFDDRPHTDNPPGGVDESVRRTDFTVSRRMDENTRPGQVVGRVFADDEDNDKLTYKLSGTDASLFDIDEATGQIRTKAGVSYDYEGITGVATCGDLDTGLIGSDRCHEVTVEVSDGLDNDRVEEEDPAADDSITVKIAVRDRDEPPAVPTVTVTAPVLASPDVATLVVFWDARNTGPVITKYDLQYRKGSGTFQDDNCGTEVDGNCTGLDDDDDDDNLNSLTTTTILALEADTSYSVRVRATNAEGTSAWSRVVTLKTNKGTNTPPTFAAIPADGDCPEDTLCVPENTPAGRDVGIPVNASDDEQTSLTYRIEGRDAASFTVNGSTGQIRTRSALNHEDPACDTDVATECHYRVRVKVEDGAGGSVSKAVTISVTDEEEAPSAPSAPRVTATKDTGQSLDVTWNEPRDAGKPPITDYDIQYRKFKAGSDKDAWELWPHGTAADAEADNTARSAKITRRLPGATEEPLEPSTQYEVRVKAKNGEDDATTANWSPEGRGTTGKSNSRPSFDRTGSLITLRVDENTRAGQNVGSAVSASDADSNALRYSLEGPGASSFTIVASSGQIRTRSPLDFETRQSYSVTVKVDDGQRRRNSVAAKSVTITVDNVIEQPPAPAAPRVAGIPGSTDSVRVTWDAPRNTGPAITEYEIHYREAGAGLGFARWTHFGVDRSTIITGLKAGTRYEVQVRAKSMEGTSDWSRSGTGMPNPDVANRNPTFSGGTRALVVAEDTLPNTDVGAPIAATDRDGDTLTYTLEGTDADSFDILSTSDGGQIRTSAALNHEAKASYSLTVRVRDGRGGTDAVSVTIRVTDVDGEAPDTPFAPTVTAESSTRLQVSWEEPDNQGPPITDYDYRYREPGGTWTEVTNTTFTVTTLTIGGLAANTSYDVEVRAKNAEGTSDWSNPGIGSTNVPGANNPPIFADGISATRSISATSPAGASIGQPVRATDADSGDRLTYSLEGRDAGLFDIDATSGQLRTRSTLIVGETYTVTVAASDGTDTSRIVVSIEATAGPPNEPPVFRDGLSTTRSVSRSARAGTAIGTPVTATDADPGATLTYSVEGPNSQSFSIDPSTGQLRMQAGVTLPVASYPVTVVATDNRGDSTRITVTITVINRPPAFSGATTSRSVPKGSPSGTGVGAPISATDPDPDDALTYSLAGTDAASFTINSSTGQISTQGAVAQELGSYPVTVVATDPIGATARITVTINVINREPVFTATSTSRSVDRNAAPGTPVGDAVTATDPNPGDTLTYSLTGTDAASFNIDGATGQLRTRAGVAIDQASYTVAVVATDQDGATARITVTITVDNRAPVFPSTSASRSVDRNSAAGTPIGGPFTATDADPDDSVTYSLSGTDAASFGINSLTGQMVTLAGVTLDGDEYTVTVVATDELAASASITVTIEVTGTLVGKFDTDGDGSISRDEVFMAILEYLGGQATRDEILGVILLYVAR